MIGLVVLPARLGLLCINPLIVPTPLLVNLFLASLWYTSLL